MISRFFKKKPKTPEPKKKVVARMSKSGSPSPKPFKFKKLLTAEGWKRLMLRKSGKSKKSS